MLSVRFATLCTALMVHAMGLAQTPAGATWHFGIGLGTGMNSQLYTCFLVKVHEEKVVDKEAITSDQFILQAKGMVQSKANPGNEDLWKKHGIVLCDTAQVTTVQEQIDACNPMSHLWKLRFQEWPLHDGIGRPDASGWSEMPMRPSDRQLLLLSEFGITHPSDICFGEPAFALLRSLRDPGWVANYKGGL
ncbi:MAG: hypothetical protein IPJ76_03795 [Flavobacteriales bacterium]|nr:MAG: hypothetical protein IPJ76_03795 [Flavobacteriales bacterium]